MDPEVAKGMEKAGLAEARRHLFFCIGPDCCKRSAGEALWDHAKSVLKRVDLPVMRTKAACFRICASGPWLVVYPDGTWYGEVTPERFDRIVKEHLQEGRPVEEWVVARNPLATGVDLKQGGTQ
jgi:(2Fe-2S) ferredoxin